MRQLKITKQITNRDSPSFNKYLTDVSNQSNVISSEEEIELARRIREGDMDARDQLVNANLRFVISVAKQYSGKAPLGDLVQEGNTGLITAAERFDETRGFKFITYAVWWIRQAIMQYISDNERKIRLPLNKVAVISKIKNARTDLEQELERDATVSEISEYLIEREMATGGDPGKYTEEKIQKLVTQSQFVGSLDAPMTGESDSGTMVDVLEGEDDFNVSKMLKNKDLQLELNRVLDKLSYRERLVLVYYYGLFDEPQISMEEIGEKFELTRERVRQIKEKGLRKLRFTGRNKILKEYV